MNLARPIFFLNTCKVSDAIACLQGDHRLAPRKLIHVVHLFHD